MRRLGWFLIGAAGATGALVSAPGLYGRLRAALGAGDAWNELEPQPDQEWGVLREAPPVRDEAEPRADEEPAGEAEPEEPEPEAEQAAAAAEPEAAEAEPEPEPEAAEPEPEPEAAEPEPEPEAAEPEPEPEAEPAEPDAYETSVWSRPAPVADAPAAEPAPAEPEAGEDEPEDDTAEIPPAPLTPAPPPEDSTASDLRSRIEASRERLHRKAQAGGSGESDDESAPDADEPDSSA